MAKNNFFKKKELNAIISPDGRTNGLNKNNYGSQKWIKRCSILAGNCFLIYKSLGVGKRTGCLIARKKQNVNCLCSAHFYGVLGPLKTFEQRQLKFCIFRAAWNYTRRRLFPVYIPDFSYFSGVLAKCIFRLLVICLKAKVTDLCNFLNFLN